jgi:hypothetical protein
MTGSRVGLFKDLDRIDSLTHFTSQTTTPYVLTLPRPG